MSIEPTPRRASAVLAAMLHEVVSHALLLGIVLASGLGFGGALLLLVADLLLVIVFSIPVHRAYSAARYLQGLLMTVVLLAFLVAMCLFASGVAKLGANMALDAATVAALLAFDPDLLLWMIALSALHLLVMLAYCWTRPDPRKAWDRTTVIASGATFLSLFLLAFVIAFGGEAAHALVSWFAPGVAIDPVLTGLMIGLRLVLACLLLLLPEWVWEEEGRRRHAR
jgi:hypothetical protein